MTTPMTNIIPGMEAIAGMPVAERTTRDGETLMIAPGKPADEDGIKAFFASVSPEDLRFRFCDTVREVDHERIAQMVSDPSVATFLARGADGTLLAIATLAADLDGEEAEVALSTRLAAKGHGVSWTLLEYVLDVAKAHGIASVRSFDLVEHRAAIKMEREMGFTARLNWADPAEVVASKALGE